MAVALSAEVKAHFKTVSIHKRLNTGLKAEGDKFNLAFVGMTMAELSAAQRKQINREKKDEKRHGEIVGLVDFREKQNVSA